MHTIKNPFIQNFISVEILFRDVIGDLIGKDVFFLTQDVVESNLPLYQSDALELVTTLKVDPGLYSHKTFEYEFPTCPPKLSNQKALFYGYDILIGCFWSRNIKLVLRSFITARPENLILFLDMI